MRVVEGKAFFRGRFEECCIGIEDGKIAKVKKMLKGDPHFNFGSSYILPAGVDVHVHFREPGQTKKEDFRSGTEAAASGGVSCVFDMPNNVPPVVDKKTYEEKSQLVANKANTDFGLYVALTEESEIGELQKLGCPFKIYMVESSMGLEFGEYSRLSETIKELGSKRHIGVHCENKNLVQRVGKDLEGYLRARPNEAEQSAIEMLIKAARETQVHICHVSAKESVALLGAANVTSEVTPHHLLLNTNTDLTGFGKVNPPIREKSDQAALWEALLAGRIDIIASDHAPHTMEEKEESFEQAPPGVPGVETSLPLMLHQVRKGNLSIERLISAMMEKPAQIMGLGKGRIEVGMDADLIAVNLRDIKKIKAEKLHSKCGWTPFENWEAIFPTATFVRGELVAREGETQESRKGKLVLGNEKP